MTPIPNDAQPSSDTVARALQVLSTISDTCRRLAADLLTEDQRLDSQAGLAALAEIERLGQWCLELSTEGVEHIPSPDAIAAACNAIQRSKGVIVSDQPVPEGRGQFAILALPVPFRGWSPDGLAAMPPLNDEGSGLAPSMFAAARFNWHRLHECDSLDYWAVVIANHKRRGKRVSGWIPMQVPNRWSPESVLDLPPSMFSIDVDRCNAVGKAEKYNHESMRSGRVESWFLPVERIDKKYLPPGALEQTYRVVAEDRVGRQVVVASGITEGKLHNYLVAIGTCDHGKQFRKVWAVAEGGKVRKGSAAPRGTRSPALCSA